MKELKHQTLGYEWRKGGKEGKKTLQGEKLSKVSVVSFKHCFRSFAWEVQGIAAPPQRNTLQISEING